MVYDIRRNPFAEVGFEAIDAHVDQFAQVPGKPFASLRICKIHKSHAWLPQVPLPHVAIRFFH
ncbi:hypothetical protein D3C81_922710 [compost metagenome]